MADATVGALRVVLGLDSAQFTEGLTAARKHLRTVGKQMEDLGGKIAGFGGVLTLGLTAPLAAFGKAAIDAAAASADALGQVEAALTSMGGASGKSVEQLQAAAGALQNMAAVDDDDILRDVTANLLTFGNISGDVFDRAQVAIVDVATRLKTDLKSATMLVAKALNDPIKGLGALRKVGIQLTEAQQNQVKAMVKAGNAAGAQAVILGELERQFKGSAKAAADNAPYARMQIALGELGETVGSVLLPMITPIVGRVTEMINAFGQLSPQMQKFAVMGGIAAAAIGPIIVAIGGAVSAIGTLTAALGAGGALAGVAAFLGPIALAAAAVAAVFVLWGDEIIPVLKDFGSQVSEVLGPKIMPLFEAVKGAVVAFAGVVSELFAAIGKSLGMSGDDWDALFTMIARGMGAAVDLLTGAINVITNVLKALGALLRGDFSAVWGHLSDAVGAALRAVLNAFETLFPGVTGWVSKMVTEVTKWLTGKLFSVLRGVIAKVREVSEAFFKLYDAVVGHSYVPDMVDGIAKWMAKLDAGMVVPAKKATKATAEAFRELRDEAARLMEQVLSDGEKAARQAALDQAKVIELVEKGIWTPGMAAAWARRRQEQQAQADFDKTVVKPIEDPGDLAQAPQKVGFFGQLFSPEAWEHLKQAGIGLGQDFVRALKNKDLEGFFAHLGDILTDKLVNDALAMLFDFLKQRGGAGSGSGWGSGGIFAPIANAVGSIFKAFPGFAFGGSLKVGGSGGTDSQFVGLRATPGEKLHITRPGQELMGGVVQVVVDKSRYFDVEVQRAATPAIRRGAGEAYGRATQDSYRAAPGAVARSQIERG